MGSYKFRVLLDTDNNQEIFRDIVIDEKENFETFYHAILKSFNFEGQEMGSFYMSNDEWDKGFEISLMDMSYSDEDQEVSAVMSQSILAEYMDEPDQKIILAYDFIRMWLFLIELQERVEETVAKPTVAMSVGIAPPEDSKMVQEDLFAGDSDDFEDDYDDEFGDEFEDGYNEEDFDNDYNY
jgi:hypothetical protein